MSNLGLCRSRKVLFSAAVVLAASFATGCSSDTPSSVGQAKDDAAIGSDPDLPIIVLPPGMDGGTTTPPTGIDGPTVFPYDGGGFADVPALCGNGVIETGEQCDDGNPVPGDGCSGICTIETGYVCPKPATLCTVYQRCGNTIIEGTESCDDGNTLPNDGCSIACLVEPGWSCSLSGCKPTATPIACGNGAVETGEQCDDGNTLPSDGCSATCQVEPHWTCPQPNKPCIAVAYCGDGVLQTERNELCDDNNGTPGDGCSGLCTIEPGYACPTPGRLCVLTWVCGNGVIDPGEVCDDGNTSSSDGCIADCSAVEVGWKCPKGANNAGGPCTKLPTNVCGDGSLGGSETCDDGDTLPNDGCSATCTAEAGWTCPTPGLPCKAIGSCGDKNLDLDLGEQCDDGDTDGADGCSPQCTVEPNWICPTPGLPCISTVKCSDGKITGTEQCDDGNTVTQDGCDSNCQLEAGWSCPIVAVPCSAKRCGDGILAGSEQCDDGNTSISDGCSTTCQLEEGWACGPNTWHPTLAATQCYRTTCGDGQPEGTEQCDDGNTRPFDGCSPSCTNEPKCGYPNRDTSQPYQCFSVCGDGLKMPDESCDDGNLRDDDGCSASCTVEPGYTCNASAAALGTSLTIPVVYRDFSWKHPQFEIDPVYNQRQVGIVNSAIGVDGKPVYNSGYVGNNSGASLGRPFTMDGPAASTTSTLMSDASGATFRSKVSSNAGSLSATDIATYFAQWYTDDPSATSRVTIQSTLTLNPVGTGVFQFYSDNFFPLDGQGFGNINYPSTSPTLIRNFCFTSEAHYWFQYQGGEQFNFRGDDDVWVFINGKLAVDLGGIHSELRGTAVLNGASTQVCVDEKPVTCADPTNCPAPTSCTTVSNGFGMVVGNIYEIIIFQAERHVTNSNYQLTLSGFNAPKSLCTPFCGDAIVTRGEACDLGSGKNTGAYGTCNGDCTLPPRCGDAAVQSTYEDCDDGVNMATYGGTLKRCGANCKWAPYCGDGIVSNGEACDEGAANGTGYGHCTAGCTQGPRCGDGVKNGIEQCDDGTRNGTTASGCTASCTMKCGNGVIEAGEQCDDGLANNIGGYGKCSPTCTFGPRCGDGIKSGAEQCDDGKNDGTYGTCSPGCVLAPYCGDGLVNGVSEVCDLGTALNLATVYGRGTCNDRCQPGPFCGDKEVEGQFGEVCDDGVNSGLPGSCAVDCSGFVPLPSCGDGIIVAPEQCDDGPSNGLGSSKCDTHCRFRCGNGVKEAGEQCDNGVNNGLYGTCNSNCTLAGYCGDSFKNGPEQCDFGPANVAPATAYGAGLCTLFCAWAPYCGDGRVQIQFGEQCDGGTTCDSKCQFTGPIPIY